MNCKKAFCLLISLMFLTNCTSGFRTFKLPTEGMSPTLKKGDWLIATPTDEIKRGDIIVFKYPKDEQAWFIFRVVGLPNEKIELKNNQVFINGNLLEESYVAPETNNRKLKEGVFQIQDNNYFVMGDNRDNSMDSRYWGTVKKDLIYGTYYTTYYHSDE